MQIFFSNNSRKLHFLPMRRKKINVKDIIPDAKRLNV